MQVTLPVKNLTAKKFHLNHPAKKPDHGASRGQGQGRARQSWAVTESGHKLPQLLDAKHAWRQGLLGVTFPNVAETEEWKITALEQCLVLVRGTQRSQAWEGAALTCPYSRSGWRSQRTPAYPGVGFTCSLLSTLLPLLSDYGLPEAVSPHLSLRICVSQIRPSTLGPAGQSTPSV